MVVAELQQWLLRMFSFEMNNFKLKDFKFQIKKEFKLKRFQISKRKEFQISN
jgi:hypothetical protein